MITADRFLDACHARGFRFITGTPCSYLKPLINAAIDDGRFLFRDAVNEGDAVAMAAGAFIGGARPLVMFQNSGLGNAVNALTSLCHPFRVPVLLVVTHRGEPGGPADEPQHELMGRITTGLLDTMGIAWARFPEEAPAEAVARACAHMDETGRPYALVMAKDAVAPQALRATGRTDPVGTRTLAFAETLPRANDKRIARTEALEVVRRTRDPRGVLIATTGYTGRELYALGDDPWNLYVVGGMGSSSALGLGLALQAPGRPVTVIDGDGAVLMRLGNLATLGAYGPATLTHVVLDNEAHESTGGQRTVSRGVMLGAVARACGYAESHSTDDPAVLAEVLRHPGRGGPRFVHFRTRAGVPAALPRPKTTPAEVVRRLRDWLAHS